MNGITPLYILYLRRHDKGWLLMEMGTVIIYSFKYYEYELGIYI